MAIDIKSVLSTIEKKFGKEAIVIENKDVEFLPSGSLSLDIALGGGWAKGRVAEIYGWESSGKSTIALHAAAQCQAQGKVVAYIDMEQALDPNYAIALGVDVNPLGGKFYLAQPDCGEDAIEIAREFARCDEVGLIIIDSVSSLVPKAVIQGEAGDAKMGLLARMLSSMVPTLIPVIKKSDCVVLFINQLREKIGVMFGDPTTTSGGNALKFYASQRVQITKIAGTKTAEGEMLSQGAKCVIKKNKVHPPFKQCIFSIVYGEGIDSIMEVVDLAVEQNIIKKSGSWFSYEDTKIGQGAEKVKTTLEDNPELFEEVREKVLINCGLK